MMCGLTPRAGREGPAQGTVVSGRGEGAMNLGPLEIVLTLAIVIGLIVVVRTFARSRSG
jgi:hypothetical protein